MGIWRTVESIGLIDGNGKLNGSSIYLLRT